MESGKNVRKSPRKKSRSPKPGAANLHSVNRWDMPKPLLAIVDEHKYVSRLLPLLEAEAAKLKQNRRADFDCLDDIMHYMVHFPDRYHHPKENLIFDRMSGLAPSTAKTVARLRRDHEKMAEQGPALHARIVAQKKSRSAAKARELADEIGFYASNMRAHMKLEETAVLQPACNTLKKADWQRIDTAIKAINDPIFGEEISERYLTLMQRYINEFISVSSSGSFPIRLVESTLSKIEQGIYTVAEMRHLPKLLVKNSSEISKARARRLGNLSKVRDWDSLGDWYRNGREASRNDWNQAVDQVKELLDSVSQPVGVEEMHDGLSTITLRTEKEILSYQERPYRPSKSPRTSWQAALVNLLGRITIKPMMSRIDLDSINNGKRLKRMAKVVPPGTHVEPVDEASFHAVWIVPDEQPVTRRTILHLPGGGFFAPATDMHRTMLGKLAYRTQSRAMLVSYRLLPEHPFPAGLEDALAAYRFLLNDGVRPEEIVISGDSAGGNLALALLLAARDEGLPLPAACALISPCTDMTFSIASRDTNRWKDPFLPSRNKTGAHDRYAGDFPLDHPLVSPIFGSFAGFPPMFAFVSSSETLLDDTLVVARKARAEGVDFEVEVWESLPHAWPLFSFLPEAVAAVERLGEFISEHLNNPEVR